MAAILSAILEPMGPKKLNFKIVWSTDGSYTCMKFERNPLKNSVYSRIWKTDLK